MDILFCAIILGIIFMFSGNVYSADFASEKEFMDAKIENVLGKTLNNAKGSYWDEMKDKGQLTCFWHKESNYANSGMNNKIHSVYDISVDKEKGVMQIKSSINNLKKNNPIKVSIADTNTRKNFIGNLAAQASVKNNAFNVQNELYAAIRKKIVVNESAIAGEMQWKDAKTDNKVKGNELLKYVNYQGLRQVKTKANAKLRTTVTIDNTEYQIIGPFRMKFNVCSIATVKVTQTYNNGKSKSTKVLKNNEGDNTVEEEKKVKNVFWIKKENGSYENEKHWNFNKIESGKYALNNKKFFLAIRKSDVVAAEGVEWKVEISQNKYSYQKSRIAVCVGQAQQQTGLYTHTKEDDNSTIEWNLGVTDNDEDCSLRVKKVDQTKHQAHGGNPCDCEELLGTKIKLYKENEGWITGEVNGIKGYTADVNLATVYDTGVIIKKLDPGKYDIYETEAPEEYNLSLQPRYTNGMVLLKEEVELTSNDEETVVIGENIHNFTTIKGKVWSNKESGKGNNVSNQYQNGLSNPLAGIRVQLFINNQFKGEAKTDSNGEYIFRGNYEYKDFDENGQNTYVNFIYDNTKYVTMEPSVLNDGSKAQEYDISVEKLDDSNLTGVVGVNYGSARTTPENGKGLADYYDYDETIKEYCIKNVNLGLIEKHEPEFSINQTLDCIKVKMNNYIYTYKYGDDSITDSNNVPTVSQQNTSTTFSEKIYPTDIVYDKIKGGTKLEVYAIYRINVNNSETVNWNPVYKEGKLFLNSLKNKYDKNRFELSSDKIDSYEHSNDFSLWKDEENEGTASYDVNNANSVFKYGIESSGTKTSYIQYKVKKEALYKILQNKIDDNDLKYAPTIASAQGYHEYLRTDNLWIHNENITRFKGVKGTYAQTSDIGKKYYVHKSINKEYSSGALYLRLELGESRKISGTVFEDKITESSKANNTNLGNGLLDNNKENRVEKVKVELLDEKLNGTELYRKTEDGGTESIPASTTSGNDGTYEFDGVVPGYYYIRFTYGNGNQKIIDVTGKEIPVNSSDYRSTIINTTDAGDIIKNAMDVTDEQLAEAKKALPANQTEAQKKIVEWYKYLNNTNYSTAIDDIDQRKQLDDCIYTKGADDKTTVALKSDTAIDYSTQSIKAQTPVISISIENDTNTSANVGKKGENQPQKYKYEGFNFGIIEQGKTIIDIDKKITNVRLTTQTGTNLVSADPQSEEAKYITALDNIIGGGTKSAKMEIENNLTYGSELAVTYQITVKNSSEYEDYLGKDYYKYGTGGNIKKKITIKEVKDILDSKYDYNGGEVQEILTDGTPGNKIVITKEDDKSLTMTNWTSMEKNETSTITYTAQTLLSSSNNPKYGNNAKVTKFSLDELTTLHSGFEWKKEDTAFTITAPTGKDKSNKYIIAAGISLSALAIGILTIKRKVLKK